MPSSSPEPPFPNSRPPQPGRRGLARLAAVASSGPDADRSRSTPTARKSSVRDPSAEVAERAKKRVRRSRTSSATLAPATSAAPASSAAAPRTPCAPSPRPGTKALLTSPPKLTGPSTLRKQTGQQTSLAHADASQPQATFAAGGPLEVLARADEPARILTVGSICQDGAAGLRPGHFATSPLWVDRRSGRLLTRQDPNERKGESAPLQELRESEPKELTSLSRCARTLVRGE